MNSETKRRVLLTYEKLKAYPFPELLLDKVKRDRGWSYSGTALAFEEYLRFLSMAIQGKRCVPSLTIDEIWHTHLTFTRHYWEEVCPKVLNYELHHEPTALEPTSNDKSDYVNTLNFYKDMFDEIPPVEVWGEGSFEALKREF